MMESKEYSTIRTRLEDGVAYLQIYRPDANNTIRDALISECTLAISNWEKELRIIIFEGLPEVFCFGADFAGMAAETEKGKSHSQKHPQKLYQLWLTLSQGPFISIAKVQGKANADGIGFVAACDIVLAEEKSTLSLSELLFSLMPACVLPFLIRKVGFQKAHYMTLMTQAILATSAYQMGLVDAVSGDVDDLLRRHLMRLTRLTKTGIMRYKRYIDSLQESKDKAIAASC